MTASGAASSGAASSGSTASGTETPAQQLLAREADWGRAPSAHNTQPWEVTATGPDTLHLGWHADRVLEARDHVERRGLPAAGGPDQDDELPVGDLEVEVVDGEGAVGVALDHVVEDDFCHETLLGWGCGRLGVEVVAGLSP